MWYSVVNVDEYLFVCYILYKCVTHFISESKKAHKLFEEADRKAKDLQYQLYDLRKSINKNFGPENEFAALDGQCYKLINGEYVYQLCLFEKVNSFYLYLN